MLSIALTMNRLVLTRTSTAQRLKLIRYASCCSKPQALNKNTTEPVQTWLIW